MHKIKVGAIVNDSIVDGPGLRLTIFLQGCNRKCCGCHNPQLQNFDDGEYFSAEEILEIAQKNPLLDGITLSGGEPFCQAENLPHLLKLFKDAGYHIAIYSGYTFEEILANDKFSPALNFTDVLVDGAFVQEKRNLSLKFRGSENQRIIDVQKSIRENKIVLEDRWY